MTGSNKREMNLKVAFSLLIFSILDVVSTQGFLFWISFVNVKITEIVQDAGNALVYQSNIYIIVLIRNNVIDIHVSIYMCMKILQSLHNSYFKICLQRSLGLLMYSLVAIGRDRRSNKLTV